MVVLDAFVDEFFRTNKQICELILLALRFLLLHFNFPNQAINIK